jgi:hypothetical protein
MNDPVSVEIHETPKREPSARYQSNVSESLSFRGFISERREPLV